ncbi:hypothetical protein OH491_27960 (plasmid) [Termitidicoccus mucosus]|uniref:hypothetical protein n=1 Tax=Termitidicoccus mucosus TaxID=1184151 RepID=UPI003184153B
MIPAESIPLSASNSQNPESLTMNTVQARPTRDIEYFKTLLRRNPELPRRVRLRGCLSPIKCGNAKAPIVAMMPRALSLASKHRLKFRRNARLSASQKLSPACRELSLVMPDFEPKAFADLFGDQSKPLIVGGQAVNLWAEVMRDQSPELLRLAPFTSTDADIVGDVALAQNWRSGAAGKSVSIPTPEIPLPPCSQGVPGGLLEVDVLRSVLGVNHADLSGGVTIEMLPGVNARVPSPLTLLKAKIGNLCALDNKRFDGTTRNDLRHASARHHMQALPAWRARSARRRLSRTCAGERTAYAQRHHHIPKRIAGRQTFPTRLIPALPSTLIARSFPRSKNSEFHKQGPRQNPGIKI